MDKAALIYSEHLASFDYGDDHPFKPVRARNTLDLCHRYGLSQGPGISRVEPKPADPRLLTLFHDPAYLALLALAGSGNGHSLEMLARGLGTEDCPVRPGLYDFCLHVVGATQLAVELVAGGKVRRAFNLVGGFHHAGRDHAEGFCYVNDVGIAIAHLLEAGRRVAFVDVDAHHCNAVQDAFYADDRVLVVSLHETGETLYPWDGAESEIGEGPGRGFNVNVPLLAGTDDEVYVEAFRQVVPPVLKAFSPDIVLAELGADTMISDPLTHLRLTNNGYYAVVRELCSLSPALVGLGGGGYDVYRSARCWTLAWSAMSEIEPEEDFAGLVGGEMYGLGMESLFDRPILSQGEVKDRARQHAEAVVARLRETVFPILGAEPP